MKRANDKKAVFRVGILGAGTIASIMADEIRRIKGVACVGVASRDYERAKKFAKCHGIDKAYTDYEQLAADDSIDLVYIATINTMHLPNALMCIKNRRNVLIEKPFAMNYSEAKEIIDYAMEAGVFVAEACPIRYIESIRYIKGMIDSGYIGKLDHIIVDLGFTLTGIDRIDKKELGGGALYDIGVYGLHYLDYFVTATPEHLHSIAFYNEFNTDIKSDTIIKYTGGMEGILRCDIACKNDRCVEIIGKEGKIIIKMATIGEEIELYRNEKKRVKRFKKNRYALEIEECKNAILSGNTETDCSSCNSTLRVMKMMDDIRTEWG